ncbi:MAG: hypothetical protein ACR2MU_00820 [Gaiellaceae bacterium]
MSDPVAWLLIERGWKVEAADGTEVGHVDELLGDLDSDIFDGLSISTGLLRSTRYVPAERVAEIVEGTVRLDLDVAAVEALPDSRS